MTGVNFNYGINTDEERAALVEYERMALAEMDDTTKVIGVKWDGDVYMPAFPRHYNERCVPVSYIALDEDNKFMIDARDYITRYSPGVWEQLAEESAPVCDEIAIWSGSAFVALADTPQPVNLTPGALGVRCEE